MLVAEFSNFLDDDVIFAMFLIASSPAIVGGTRKSDPCTCLAHTDLSTNGLDPFDDDFG